jgi:hypothetical protein
MSLTFPATISSSTPDQLRYVRDVATGTTLYTFEGGEYDLDLSFVRPTQSFLLPGSDAPYDPFGSGGFPLDKRTVQLKWLKRYRVGETHSSNRIAFHRAIADGRQVQLVLLDSGGAEWIGLAKATSVPTQIQPETMFKMDMGVTFELNPPVFRQLYPPGWFYWDAPGIYWDGGVVGSVTINTPGAYTVAPTGVTFTGTTGSAARGVLSFSGAVPHAGVASVTMLDAGLYSTAPTGVSFIGGTGTAATGTVQTSGVSPNITVTGVTITSAGDYTNPPETIAFTGGVLTNREGSAATGTVQTGGIAPNIQVTGVTITAGGLDYGAAPAIAFTGGTGTAATATATMAAGGDGFLWDSNTLPTIVLTAASQSLVFTNAGDAPEHAATITVRGAYPPFDLLVYDAGGTLRGWVTWAAGLTSADVLVMNNATGQVTLNGVAAFDPVRFVYRGDNFFAFWPGNSTLVVQTGYSGSATGALTVDARSARY